MMSVGRVAEYSAMSNAIAPKSTEELAEKKTTTIAADNTDKFVKSEVTFTPAYTRAAVTENHTNSSTDNEASDKQQNEQAAAAKNQKNDKVGKGMDIKHGGSLVHNKNELMQNMVQEMLTGQAKHNGKSSPMSELEEIIRSYAEEAEKTADGDENYWNAENTANRILDFAKSLAGGDEKNIETLRKAFEKGFGASEKVFGGKGKLPSISYETYDLVQKGFDDWSKEFSKEAEKAADEN